MPPFLPTLVRNFKRTMLVTASLAFFVGFACLLVLVSAPVRRFALDHPNSRSLHQTPVPRSGGLAIVAGVAASLAIVGNHEPSPLLLALALAAVSFIDDLFGLPALLRFALHLSAAACFVAIQGPNVGPVAILMLIVSIAWSTNLYNFMDGSDGLAAGMAVAGFGAYAIAAQSAGAISLAAASIALAFAASAFLLFNFPPAKIFMGDVGSIPLGFLAAVLGISGWQSGAWPLWFPLVVFSPFAADASITLAKRLFRREKVWAAHREHYYQKLVRMGFGHRNTALAAYLLMIACAGAALAARSSSEIAQIALLGLCAFGYALLALWIDARWDRHVKAALE